MEAVDENSIPSQPTDSHMGQPLNPQLPVCNCYILKSDTGSRWTLDGIQYTEALAGSSSASGKFQLCRDEQCQPGLPVDPNHGVYIRDIYGAASHDQILSTG
ncbi:unnamed protein product [Penicillium viridicatum]